MKGREAFEWQCGLTKHQGRHGKDVVRTARDYLSILPQVEGWEVMERPISARLRSIVERRAAKQSVVARPDQNAPSHVVVESLQRKLAEVEKRLAAVEECIIFERGEPVSDPSADWCVQNRAKLLEHKDSFVAIDIEAGKILVADTDENDFVKQMEKIPTKVRARLYQVHTSAFE